MPVSLIRSATIEDAAEICRISFDMGYSKSSVEDTQWRLKSILKSENSFVFVNIQDDQLTGWIHGFVTQPLVSRSFVEIGGLVVDSEQRRCGMGRGLVEHAQCWAHDRKLTIRVRCNTNRVDALAFYRALNLQMIKTQQVFTNS